MGEYEDRYPEAYRPAVDAARPPQPADAAGSDHFGARPTPPATDALIPTRRRDGLQRRSLFAEGAAEPRPAWRHRPSTPPPTELRLVEPIGRTGPDGTFRGVGPLGYVRAPQRIYEDICDRLTEHPFIDASQIEVAVSGSEVTLSGRVDSAIALHEAAELAGRVTGVTLVHNELSVR